MITCEPTPEMLEQWKSIWLQYKGRLVPNRKTGEELLAYLQGNYVLTELFDARAREVVTLNVTLNAPFAQKLPAGVKPVPRAFFVENEGGGKRLYLPGNKDPDELWGKRPKRIFVGIDTVTGYYTVEGSTLLWDELCAFVGLDEFDIQNYVCVAQYILAVNKGKHASSALAGLKRQ